MSATGVSHPVNPLFSGNNFYRRSETMLFSHRLRLLAFGLFVWAVSMFTAAETTSGPVAVATPVQAGIGAGLFVTALLPGRMARFS